MAYGLPAHVRQAQDATQTGVTDLITVRPPASPERVESAIEDAFKREAEVDARRIRVEVSDHTAMVYGHVLSLREASAGAGRGRLGAGSSHRR